MQDLPVEALLIFAGLLITQALLHRRWTTGQRMQQQAAINRIAEQRKAEAKQQADERRREQKDVLEQISEQTNNVVTAAMQLLEVHQKDAESERLRTAAAVAAHVECRQEVAEVRGEINELRLRMTETERTAGFQARMAELHGALKHDALNALAAAEGSLAVAAKAAERGNLEAIIDLVGEYEPKGPTLVEENKQVHHIARAMLEEGSSP